MSAPNQLGDPRTGRNRRVPTKARTFQHGTLDPIINHRRPLLTVGNGILLIVGIGFGMYATGNLPQLDAFFAHIDAVGRAHNSMVVNTLITYGAYLFGAVILALAGLMIFLFINSNRRSLSDPRGWHKVASAPASRRESGRRNAGLPSMVMPIGKERPAHRSADPKPGPVAAAPAKANTPTPAEVAKPDAAKAEAMAAAAKTEAAIAKAPADLPSFVRPLGKMATPKPETISPAAALTSPAAKVAAPAPPARENPQPSIAAPPAISPATTPTTNTSALLAAGANARVAAAIAKAAKAEAAVAAAKAEAAIAAAKAEAAVAEAEIAAAKAEAMTR